MFDREKMELQQAVRDAICGAARDVQKSFVHAAEVVDKSVSMIVGHPKLDETATPGSSSAYPMNHESRRSRTRDPSERGGAPVSDILRSSAPASSAATKFSEFPSRC